MQNKTFTKIVLKTKYNENWMEQDCFFLTAFNRRHGHFEFVVLLFFLTDAPATFVDLMNKVFVNNLDSLLNLFVRDL